MATGLYTDFVVRDALFRAAFIERVNQNVNVFNAASNGAIRMVSESLVGHYAKTSFLDRLTGGLTRRNIGDMSALTDTAITQDELVSVKLNRKFGPYAQTLDAFKKAGISMDEFSVRLGQMLADEMAKDYANTAFNAVEAALSQHDGGADFDLVYDHTGTGTLTHAALIGGLAKFGDAADRIVCWVMHSKPFYDLMAANVTVASGNVAGMTLVNADVASLNRPIIVSDSSYLTTGSTPEYVVLGLQAGAVTVTESEAPTLVVTPPQTGFENIFIRMQGESALNVAVKGHAWDIANGGLNPTDAAVGTATNWDAKVADKKDAPGVYIWTQ